MVACKKCGGTKWVQVEVRKTGVVFLGGVACLSAHCLIEPVKVLLCQGCGEGLTSDESKAVIQEAHANGIPKGN